MKNIELNTVATAIDIFSAIAEELPPKSEQAWTFSSDSMASHLREHAGNDDDLGTEEEARFAKAQMERHQQQEQTQKSLSGLFSEGDVVVLMNYYQCDMLDPDPIDSIVSDLCNHLGVELDVDETCSIALLVDKLQGLSAEQSTTLGDALEGLWWGCLGMERMYPKEFFAYLGIELT